MNDITKSRLTVFGLLALTVRYFLDRFKPLLAVYLLVFVPQSLLFTYMDVKTGHFHNVAPSSLGYVMAIVCLLIPIDVLILTPLAYQYALKRKTDFYPIVDGLFRRYFRVLVTFLAVMLIGLFFCVFLIVPGIIASVYLSLALNLAAHEGIGLKKAIQGSYRLVKGNWWYVFGVMIVTTIIYFFLALSLSLALMVFLRGNAYTVVNGIGSYCISMFYSSVACLMFANLHLIGKEKLAPGAK
jgi:hypothetical protein